MSVEIRIDVQVHARLRFWGRVKLLAGMFLVRFGTRLLGSTYYEAHVRVPGVLEFYGDFRIGGAFGLDAGIGHRDSHDGPGWGIL